jgi:hypothetical protein
MTEINKRIQEARPNLRLVSPLAAAIVLGYGVVNIALGVGLFFYVNPSPDSTFAIITAWTPFQLWGVVFLALGLFKLYTLYKNDWVNMRRSLIVGILIKSVWFIALFFRFLDGGSILMLVIWFFFMYIQMVTYIHFIPNIKQRLT